VGGKKKNLGQVDAEGGDDETGLWPDWRVSSRWRSVALRGVASSLCPRRIRGTVRCGVGGEQKEAMDFANKKKIAEV
jgi:hypothetical protein